MCKGDRQHNQGYQRANGNQRCQFVNEEQSFISSLMAGGQQNAYHYVKLTLPTRTIRCILDSGSSSCLMNSDFFRRTFQSSIVLGKSTTSIQVANGEKMSGLFYYECNV